MYYNADFQGDGLFEKYVHFRIRQKHVLRNFFSPRISNLIHVLRKYFSNYGYLKDLYKNWKEIGISKLHRRHALIKSLKQ